MRTLFETRSWIDGIGLKAGCRIARLCIRSDCLGKRVDFDTGLHRAPRIDNRNDTKVCTRKVQARSLFREADIVSHSNLPTKVDKLDRCNTTRHLEVALAPENVFIVLLPKTCCRFSCRRRIARNHSCILAKFDCSHNSNALLLKGLT